MTTVAWDGRVLAADRRGDTGFIYEISKLMVYDRTDGRWALACAGQASDIRAYHEWFAGGEIKEEKPVYHARMEAGEVAVVGIVVHLRDQVAEAWQLEGHFRWRLLPGQHFARGSGKDFAMMAMKIGKTAAQAVELTCGLDPHTGFGVDYIDCTIATSKIETIKL